MEKSFHLRSYVRIVSFAGQACAQQGRWDEAVELSEQALHAAQDYSDDSMISAAAGFLSAVYTYKRDLNQAITYGELAVARAPTPADKAWTQGFLAWPLCHAGETGRGVALLEGLPPLFRAVRMVWMELWCTFFLAEGYWLAGEYDKGKRTAEELLAIAERTGARFCSGYARFLLGEMLLETEPKQAAAFFEKSIPILEEIGAESALPMAYCGMGRYYRKQGNSEMAREYLTQALKIFDRLGTLIEPDKARKELAELPPTADSAGHRNEMPKV
jgi:tetratricopeptide (TPR) repeat protein